MIDLVADSLDVEIVDVAGFLMVTTVVKSTDRADLLSIHQILPIGYRKVCLESVIYVGVNPAFGSEAFEG